MQFLTIPSTRWAGVICALFLGACVSAQAQETSTESQVDQLLATLDAGNSIEDEVINLSDILFEFDSPELTTETKPYLNKVVQLMSRVPNMTVQIDGHTDNVGASAYNQKLSLSRAQSVRSYLIANSIDSTRIGAEGYGDQQPLALNNTAEGRAKNRRVEITITKPATVETLQDLIILANGDTIGGIVILANDSGVRYKGFSSDEEKFLPADRVVKVIYATGRVWTRPAPVVKQEEPVESQSISEWWTELKSKYPFLQSPPTFEPGTRVIMVSAEIPTNLTDELEYNTRSAPGFSITYDKARRGNWGLGWTLAGRWWGDPTLAYNFVYGSIGFRGTYHLNFHPKLDTYFGLVLTHRRVQFWNQDYLEGNGVTDINGLLGARYYFAGKLGIVAEAGSDAIARFRTGLCYRF